MNRQEKHEVQLSDGETATLIPVYGKGEMRTDTLLYWTAYMRDNPLVTGYGTGISEALVDLLRFRRDLP